MPSPAGVSAPRLTGHTTGTADNTGLINVTDFLIVAEAEEYILSFTLTDFPMVQLLMPHEHECTCANQLGCSPGTMFSCLNLLSVTA